VGNRSRDELVAYVDQLIPAYELSQDAVSANRDGRATYHWSEFLKFYYDENFIRNAYLCIFRREPDTYGMQSSLQALRIEKCPRIVLLGRLHLSEEASRHNVAIRGLWIRYQMARLQRIPFLGAILSIALNLSSLSRPDIRLDALDAGIHEQVENIESAEQEMTTHFRQVADRLHYPLFQVKSDTCSGSVGAVAPESMTLSLSRMLALSGADFVVSAYRVVRGRAPLDLELEIALAELSAGEVSKTLMLARLFDSAEARISRADIKGLPRAYAREKLFALPILGFFLQLPGAIKFLSRAHTIMEFQRGKIAECEQQVIQLETRLMGHYNDTVSHLKREFVELVKSDPLS